MKKTLTVNLNNIVFHIDDDAYDMLQTYLTDVSHHLSEDERAEVMKDIEARVAELFTERLQRNKNVINISDVEEIINILGKPSQYGEEEDSTETEQPKTGKKHARRFYRDPDNAVLGGVAAGVAAYFSWDVTWVRIAFVVLALISAGNMIPIYLLVWIVAPKAVTASQRLEMQGEDVTVENIKSEINNVKSYIESDKFKQSASNFGDRFVEVMRTVFKVLFSFLGAILGFAGMVILGVLIIFLLFAIFEPAVLNGFSPELLTDWNVLSPDKAVLLIISLLLVLGCPILILVFWLIRIISGRPHERTSTSLLVVLILWLAGLFMFYSVGAHTMIKWNKSDRPWMWNWTWKGSDAPVTDETRTVGAFSGIDISGNIELELTQDSVQNVVVSTADDLHSYVKTEIRDGILEIYTDKTSWHNSVKVKISADSIYDLRASGASRINTVGTFNTSRLNMDLSGASQANMDLNVTNAFDVEVSGASFATFQGNANSTHIEVNGAGKYDGLNLLTKYAEVDVSGAGHANVYASESLNAEVSGAGDVHCEGNPKNVKQNVSLGSHISVK